MDQPRPEDTFYTYLTRNLAPITPYLKLQPLQQSTDFELYAVYCEGDPPGPGYYKQLVHRLGTLSTTVMQQKLSEIENPRYHCRNYINNLVTAYYRHVRRKLKKTPLTGTRMSIDREELYDQIDAWLDELQKVTPNIDDGDYMEIRITGFRAGYDPETDEDVAGFNIKTITNLEHV